MSKPRTQKQIIDAISKDFRLPIRKGRAIYARLIEEFTLELIHSNRIEMAGLGVFAVDIRPEHTTVHPSTGQPVTIPTKKTVRYRSARPLRRRLNPESDPE